MVKFIHAEDMLISVDKIKYFEVLGNSLDEEVKTITVNVYFIDGTRIDDVNIRETIINSLTLF